MESRGGCGKCSVAKAPAGSGVDDYSVPRVAARWLHTPGLRGGSDQHLPSRGARVAQRAPRLPCAAAGIGRLLLAVRSEEHTSELQSHSDLVCRLLLEKKKNNAADDGILRPSYERSLWVFIPST